MELIISKISLFVSLAALAVATASLAVTLINNRFQARMTNAGMEQQVFLILQQAEERFSKVLDYKSSDEKCRCAIRFALIGT